MAFTWVPHRNREKVSQERENFEKDTVCLHTALTEERKFGPNISLVLFNIR